MEGILSFRVIAVILRVILRELAVILRELYLMFCLITLHQLLLALLFILQRLLPEFLHYFLQNLLKRRPAIRFFLAKNKLIIEDNFKTANIRKEYIFLRQRVIIFIFLFFNWQQINRYFITYNLGCILFKLFFN